MPEISIALITNEIATASEWQSLKIIETIGEPDRMSVDVLAFMRGDEAMTANAVTLFTQPGNYFYGLVKRDTEILFSGLVRLRGGEKEAVGAIKWNIQATGWEFLAPKRLVGVPNGSLYLIQEEGDPDRLPTAVAVDPSAIAAPNAASVKALWQAYWNYPAIDLDTYVFDILPVGVTVEQLTWSGSDLDGATHDLAAAGSSAALWWLANDSPNPQNITAPHLALHFGVVVMPDEGDEGDDLLAGFPSADAPVLVAPYFIDNDTPDPAASPPRILATYTKFDIDQTEQDDAVYVRGATGYSEEVLAAPLPLSYQIGPVVEGGTGWVGSPGGVWGARYLDAPAAVTPEQRDAFGLATLEHSAVPQWTGTIKVVGYDGWHKGQALRVTDQDWGMNARWFLIRSVELTQHGPLAIENEYTLTVGDTMSARLGFALRQQRLAEQRKEIAPATRFVMYVGDLTLAPGETAAITAQLANDAGKAMAVKGVTAQWFIMVNGANLTNPLDTGALFYLSALVEVTDEAGQVTATLHAGAGVTGADAAAPFAKIAP